MHRRDFVAALNATLAGGALAASAAHAAGGGETAKTATASLDLAGFNSSRRYVDTRFGRIAFFERGKGPAALFLHGFPLNGFQWRGAIERLAPFRRCVAPDFLGLGYTEVAEGQSLAPEAQLAMVAALLDRLAIQRVDVIANDSGGAIAQLLVTRHPDRVRSLLLTNCDAENDSPPPALLPVIEMAHAGKFADSWLAPWLADPVLARSAEGIGGMCYVDPAHPTDEAISCYFRPLLSSPERKALLHQYAIALERNPLEGIEPLLRQCRVPTRILWGTGDTIFSPESPDYLDRVFGNSQGVRRLPGRKLFWPEELPEVIAEEAKRLWSLA